MVNNRQETLKKLNNKRNIKILQIRIFFMLQYVFGYMDIQLLWFWKYIYNNLILKYSTCGLTHWPGPSAMQDIKIPLCLNNGASSIKTCFCPCTTWSSLHSYPEAIDIVILWYWRVLLKTVCLNFFFFLHSLKERSISIKFRFFFLLENHLLYFKDLKKYTWKFQNLMTKETLKVDHEKSKIKLKYCYRPWCFAIVSG